MRRSFLSMAVSSMILALPSVLSAQTVVVTGDGSTFSNPAPGTVSDPSCSMSPNTWCAANVRVGAQVGITSDSPRSGNGSIYLSGADGVAKADYQYFFGSPFQLSSLQSFGYDYFRANGSTNPAVQVPSLRMLITNGSSFGQLIYEPTYNGASVAEGAWHTASIGASTNLWLFQSGCGPYENFGVSLGTWQSANGQTNNCGTTVNGDWIVYGMNTGIGSGWNGAFEGAVDNINYRTSGMNQSVNFNFEVDGAASVPEPASIALMFTGLLALGLAARRRAQQ